MPALMSHTVVIWWIFVSLMWLHTVYIIIYNMTRSCDLMNFCIFDVITYSCKCSVDAALQVVIWWIFVSLMWLHTVRYRRTWSWEMLWFDEFLYLWCDYIQLIWKNIKIAFRCDLMNFCIFDVITYSISFAVDINIIVVIWWIFVSLMWLHTVISA